MIDESLVQQLKDVFSKLEGQIELVFDDSDHSKQSELVEMLNSVAATSQHITTKPSGSSAKTPKFSITRNSIDTGIVFSGIPGGHEFSSLIVAILNADEKGKLPDQGLINRIKNLKGPIDIKTYISLSCENCPQVVQALNQMAIFHPDFKHTMVDGDFAQSEVDDLNIQAVPSVMVNGELLSAGKTSFAELLGRVEKQFGTKLNEDGDLQDLGHYDVTVVGAGPAGASAAIYSARKGLKTLVIAEKVGGQLQDTKGIENLISIPYTEGPQLSAQLVEHMSVYNIEILEHRRIKEIKDQRQKTIILESRESITTDSLIIATGAKWRELNVPGEKQYIGTGVAFCPHCDGPYYKNKDIAIVGGGNSGVEAAIDLAGIVKSITLIEFSENLKADDVLIKKLKTLDNVKILTNAKTSQINGDGSKVTGLEYEDRSTNQINKLDLDGVFVQIGLIPNSDFAKDVVNTNNYGEIIVDDHGRTSSKGIYAAGDVTTVPYKQIVISMGDGAKAALASFEDQMVS